MPSISGSSFLSGGGGGGVSNLADLNDVQLALLSDDNLLQYNSIAAAWTNVTPGSLSSSIDHNSLSNYVANQHIDWTSASSNLVTTGYGTFNDLNSKWLDLTTGLADPTYQSGRIFYDNANNTLCVYSDVANTSLQVGQEQLVRVVNKTGITLSDGMVVYISGAQGNRPTAAKADADLATADKTIGVVTADILDNAEGYVCIHGVVRNFNTTGFTTGDELFVSQTAGAITNVAPVHPLHDVRVGWALNSTANGAILVAPHTASSLNEIHDVLLTAPSNNDVLTYETATGLWKNKTSTSGVTDHGALTGLLDDDHTQYALLAGRVGHQTLIGSTASGGTLTLQSTANATKGKINFGSSAYDEVNNRLGIAMSAPTVALDVTGDAKISGDLSVDTNVLKVDTTNNRIGVNVTSPSYTVQVEGSVVGTVYSTLKNTNGTSPASLQVLAGGQSVGTGLQIRSQSSSADITCPNNITIDAPATITGQLQINSVSTPGDFSLRTFAGTHTNNNDPDVTTYYGTAINVTMSGCTYAAVNSDANLSQATTLFVSAPIAGTFFSIDTPITIQADGVSVFGNYGGGQYTQVDGSGNLSSKAVTATSFNLSALNTAPANAGSTGTTGQIKIDANYIYICTATNTWKRVAIATW